MSLQTRCLGTRAVFIVDQFEKEKMEHGNQQSDRAPEQHGKTTKVMTMLV